MPKDSKAWQEAIVLDCLFHGSLYLGIVVRSLRAGSTDAARDLSRASASVRRGRKCEYPERGVRVGKPRGKRARRREEYYSNTTYYYTAYYPCVYISESGADRARAVAH